MRTLDYPAMVAFDDGFEKGHKVGYLDGAKAALKDAGWNDEAIEEWLSEVGTDDGYNEADYRP